MPAIVRSVSSSTGASPGPLRTPAMPHMRSHTLHRKAGLADLAGVGLGEGVADLDVPGDHVVLEPGPAVPADGVLVEHDARPGRDHHLDGGAVELVGHTDDRGLADVLELVEHVLDLLGADLLALALEDVVAAAHEVEEALVVG